MECRPQGKPLPKATLRLERERRELPASWAMELLTPTFSLDRILRSTV